MKCNIRLVCYNPEINWKTRKVKMTRCPDEYKKQWKTKQMKSRWQKQKKKQFRKPIVEEEIKIARMIEEKQKEEKDLIEIRIVEEIVLEGSTSIWRYLRRKSQR